MFHFYNYANQEATIYRYDAFGDSVWTELLSKVVYGGGGHTQGQVSDLLKPNAAHMYIIM